MTWRKIVWPLLLVCILSAILTAGVLAAGEPAEDTRVFPPSLDSYNDYRHFLLAYELQKRFFMRAEQGGVLPGHPAPGLEEQAQEEHRHHPRKRTSNRSNT